MTDTAITQRFLRGRRAPIASSAPRIAGIHTGAAERSAMRRVPAVAARGAAEGVARMLRSASFDVTRRRWITPGVEHPDQQRSPLMRLSSSPSALLLALPLLGHVACGGTVAATTQGTGGSSSSTTTTGTTSTTTGTGGADACGATADSLSFSLTTYDGTKFPASPGPVAPPLVLDGKVTQYDATARVIEIDSCGPAADCVPLLSKFEILGAKGSFYPSIAPGSFLRIEAVGDLSGWMIQIKSLPSWQGEQNPAGPADNLVFAAFMGESNGITGMVPEFPSPIADAPFQVSLAALPCGPASGGPTPGYQPFMLRFTGPTLKSPVDVHMGEGGVASATSDGQYWQFENLQSSELPAGTPPDGPDQYWVTYFLHNTLPGE